MAKKADILKLYEILETPYVIRSKDIMLLFGCSRATALNYMKKVQNNAAKKNLSVDSKYITKKQLLDYEGWDFEEIQRNALTRLSIQK